MTEGSTVRHAVSAMDKQRLQLERLLKDPSKPAFIPPPPKEKTIRPPKDMMKNVQGSSAGAGSGEFHVYKANRRREYERVKLMEEQNLKARSTRTCVMGRIIDQKTHTGTRGAFIQLESERLGG